MSTVRPVIALLTLLAVLYLFTQTTDSRVRVGAFAVWFVILVLSIFWRRAFTTIFFSPLSLWTIGIVVAVLAIGATYPDYLGLKGEAERAIAQAVVLILGGVAWLLGWRFLFGGNGRNGDKK